MGVSKHSSPEHILFCAKRCPKNLILLSCQPYSILLLVLRYCPLLTKWRNWDSEVKYLVQNYTGGSKDVKVRQTRFESHAMLDVILKVADLEMSTKIRPTKCYDTIWFSKLKHCRWTLKCPACYFQSSMIRNLTNTLEFFQTLDKRAVRSLLTKTL